MAWWGESARKRRVGTWQIWSGATSSREGLTHIGRTGGRGTTLVTNVDGRVTDGVTAHDAPEGAGVAEVGCDPPTATERTYVWNSEPKGDDGARGGIRKEIAPRFTSLFLARLGAFR